MTHCHRMTPVTANNPCAESMQATSSASLNVFIQIKKFFFCCDTLEEKENRGRNI